MIPKKSVNREYTYTTVSEDGKLFFGGTFAGEIAVYDLNN